MLPWLTLSVSGDEASGYIGRFNRRDGSVPEIGGIARDDEAQTRSLGADDLDVVLEVVAGKRESSLKERPIHVHDSEASQAHLNSMPCAVDAHLFAADIEDVGEDRGRQIAEKLTLVPGIPHGLRLRVPGLSLQKQIEHDIRVR